MFKVLYHGGCYDGHAAAWVARKAIAEAGAVASFIPCFFGRSVPEIEHGDRVYVLDFSFPRAVLEQMHERAASMVVLDHHATAEADLDGLDYCYFDMEKSGAVLAWETFYGGLPVPEILRYVQDRDLLRNELPHSAEIVAAIRSWPMDFAAWDQLVADWSSDGMYRDGRAIMRMMGQRVDETCAQARMIVIDGHRVPIVNASAFFGEVQLRMLELHPDAPFVVYYFDRADGLRQHGLWSRGDFDVTSIAQARGGGGHKAASGFTTTIPPMGLDVPSQVCRLLHVNVADQLDKNGVCPVQLRRGDRSFTLFAPPSVAEGMAFGRSLAAFLFDENYTETPD